MDVSQTGIYLVIAILLIGCGCLHDYLSKPNPTSPDGIGKAEGDILVEEAKFYAHEHRLIIVACLAKFAKIDGVVTRNEVSVLETIFGYLELTGAARQSGIDTFKYAKSGKATLRSCVQLYREACNNDQEWLAVLIMLMFRVANADGPPNVQTRQALVGLCHAHDLDFEKCAQLYEETKNNVFRPSQGVEAAYVTLGCQPNDSPNVIKDRYRKLVKDFHPDTIMAKNLPAEFVKFAEERFKQIQAAYDTIMESRTAGKT